MTTTLALIGFGEAARAFAGGLDATMRAYDLRRAADMAAAMSGAGVDPRDTPADALAGADAALSLVTADQALPAARAAAGLVPGAYWFDMNSVAPDTKRAAADAIAAAGGRYVDVAVMAPVHPARTAVPLLVSGPHAADGAALLSALGFGRVRVVAGDVGAASAIKMIRSVMVKGIEALSAECAMAASAAGVLGEVVASLDASPPPATWAERFDYNLDRMLVHGLRRSAEMNEVVATLDALGTGSVMSRGTVQMQARLGKRRLAPPPTLDAKLRAILPAPSPLSETVTP